MTWAGLAAILIAGIEFTGAEFPGYAALLPVIGAALVIAGGIGLPVRHGVGVLLGRRPLRLIGDTSYSFYLWHWPVLIIAAQYEGHQLSVRVNLLLLGAAFCLSVATYYLFENPIRHSERLAEPKRGSLSGQRSVSDDPGGRSRDHRDPRQSWPVRRSQQREQGLCPR